MRLRVFIRKTHRWLGLLIGLQVLFWVAGGLLMSWFPIDQIHGDHLRKEPAAIPLQLDALVQIKELISASGLDVIKSELSIGHFGAEYRLTDSKKTLHFYDAKTGNAMPALSSESASTIASKLYNGTAAIVSSQLMETNDLEYRKRVPAWRIQFDDSESSAFYIAADNGELMSVRNTRWRIFDFVWMLHIMDYENRDNINGWLLTLSALIALLFTLSGGYLVVKSFRKKDFGFRS